MIEYYTHSAGHCFDGVQVLRYKIALPHFSGRDKISVFYREIYNRALGYCESELCSLSEKKYAECNMPRKKFDYPPLIYRLEGRVTCVEGDLVFVKLTASVSQRGLSDTLTVYDPHVWSLSEELLLPPKMAAREYMGTGKASKKIGKNGFLVENGKPYVCLKNVLLPLDVEKKND